MGKPDKRERLGDGWEDWTYHKHRIMLRVAEYLPNRKGEGVYLGTVSKYLYRKSIRLTRSRFIQKPLYVFSNPEFDKAKKIDDLIFKLESAQKTASNVLTRFEYAFAAKNLRFQRDEETYNGSYRSKWVLYDEDYRILKTSDEVKEVVFQKKSDVRQNEIFQKINLQLIPGSYLLALRIEDTRSDRLGIYRKRFRIKNKGSIQEFENGSQKTNQ